MSPPTMLGRWRRRANRAEGFLFFLVLVGATFALRSARASAQVGLEPPGYRQAIRQALSEYDSQHYLEARTLFAQAHALYPNARSLRGLGIVSFELRRYSESVSYLRQALAAGEKPLDAELRADSERLLTRARAFVAELRITVQPVDAQLSLDGAEPKPVSGSLLLNVGEHNLEFSAPGHLPSTRPYTVVGGEELSWRVLLSPLNASSSQPGGAGKTPPTGGLLRWHRAVGGLALGLGAASFAAAAILATGHYEDGEKVLATGTGFTGYPLVVEDWQNGRAAPYAFGALGAAALTSGALGLLLKAEPEAFPRWATALVGVAGLGLAAWGIVDVAQGSSCNVEPLEIPSCVEDQQRRDRGALVLLAAAPLLSVSVTQIVRGALSAKGPDLSFSVHPKLSPLEVSTFLGAVVRWL